MTKKYEITDITHPINKRIHRIRALCDIPAVGVKTGDLGGWIERRVNLSQYGDSWVFDNAQVFGNAQVSGNAQISDDAWVFDNARVSGKARVFRNARVSGKARVFRNARVFDEACVYGVARIFDDARVSGKAQVFNTARVCGQAHVRETGEVLCTHVIASDLYDATLHRTTEGHDLHVGCWTGTVSDFRTMIDSNEWVEATPEQIELRRPELLAFADMCEARIATWGQQ